MRYRVLLPFLVSTGCTTLLGVDKDYELDESGSGGATTGGGAGGSVTGGAGGAGATGGSSGGAGGTTGGAAGVDGGGGSTTGGAGGTGGATGGAGGSGGNSGGSGGSGGGGGGSGGGTGGSGGSTGGSGGSTGGSGGTPGCPVLGSTFPTTPVLDNFNAANGPPSSANWLLGLSDYYIESGALRVIPQTGDANLVWHDVRCADQEAYLTVKTMDTAAAELYLNLKRQSVGDGCNNIEILYDPAAGELGIYTCDSGNNWVGHGTAKQTLVAGDVFGGRARANGTVELYVNGVLKISASLAAWPHYAKPGYIGMGWSGPKGTGIVDDFGGG